MARRPRTGGLLVMVLSGIAIARNDYVMRTPDALGELSYYPAAYVIAYPGAAIGLWFLITGRSFDLQAPRWWVVGMALVTFGSLGYGIYLLVTLHLWT